MCCNKSYQWKFNENLKEGFFNTYKFSNHEISKHFYNHLNIEDITYAGYDHSKRVCKDCEVKKLGEYHDLYFQS